MRARRRAMALQQAGRTRGEERIGDARIREIRPGLGASCNRGMEQAA